LREEEIIFWGYRFQLWGRIDVNEITIA
jgi:hypothetical protein